MTFVVKVENLKLSYGKNEVIRTANFEILKGDFVCVVGANGSGKSTLIKAILGLLKPAAGKIKYGEKNMRNAIGYLPQELKLSDDFPATVDEIVASGMLGKMKHRWGFDTEEKEEVDRCMRELGLGKLKKRKFAELSGGQKQKVLLARALVANSGLLILDEPANNLDYESRKEFYGLLKKINAESGMTIVMITHDLDAEDLIGDKVLAINDGRITLASTKKYLESYR